MSAIRLLRVLSVCLVVAARLHAQGDFQGSTQLMPFDEGMIQYSKAVPDGPVARLQAKIDRGQVKLQYDPVYGWLPSVLKALNIPAESQMLVFSKTSLQRAHIGPQNPRAIYYNDDAYVGWIPGAPLMEVSSVDPKLGGIFYSLQQKETAAPKFVRTDQCLECHASTKTMGVPGHLVRSFQTDSEGEVDLISGSNLITHRSPFEERWGGWYIQGPPQRAKSRGTDFTALHEIGRYLRPQSDTLALMVLEHQSHMHNFITRLNYEGQTHLSAYQHIRYLKNVVEAFLRYLLFTEETPLPGPIKRTEFAAQFEKLGPCDRKGRSLRQFNLKTRLFEYPCSYLIYSEAFDSLPEAVRQAVYGRLHDILEGRDMSPEFRGIPAESRQAILEILTDTKPEFSETTISNDSPRSHSGSR